MVCIFEFSIESHDYWFPGKKFGQDLGLLKDKKHSKMASLPFFSNTESSLGRMNIWRGK